MDKEKCFIIAPISTLPDRAPSYFDDVAHCEHVINHLLAPAVEKAGFDPVKPKARGANLIHAEIVKNLQTAGLVLCDMSGLNPNVFFELGVRTAMNKPICLVIDEATKDAPFDLDIVNHHRYVSDLRPWVLPAEVDKIAAHIRESFGEKENALWKHFALRITADSAERPSGPDDKLDLLLSEVNALRRQVAGFRQAGVKQVAGVDLQRRREDLTRKMTPELLQALQRREDVGAIVTTAQDIGLRLWQYTDTKGTLSLWIDPEGAKPHLIAQVTSQAAAAGIDIAVNVAAARGSDPKEPEESG